jgi:putative hydroxymethylpyrimidine transport system substrate-binding protein
MKRSRIPVLALAVALAALALGLAACGKKSADTTAGEAQPLSLTLDFYPNPDHAGIYMAQKLGYFEEAGLDVSITAPSEPSAPIKQVAAGRSDLAISYEPELALAREQGLDVVAVAALVNRPLTSMIWLRKSGIKSVPGLKGKTVATAGIPYQDAFLKTILARAKLSPGDVKSVNVGFGLLPALVSGSAQAMLGGYSNVEGVDLRERGKDPVITPVDQLGVPTYDELVLVANRKSLEADPEKIRLFIAALQRGTDAAAKQPNEATAAILEANSGLDPKLTKAEVEATLPLLSARTKGQPFGYMDPAEWKAFVAWMHDNELIATLPSGGELLTNAYLPGAIPE